MPESNQLDNRYIDINGVAYYPGSLESKKTLNSRFLLNSAFDLGMLDPKWKSIIERILAYVGFGNTVWGIKKQEETLFLECYFYYPDIYPSHNIETIMEMIHPFVIGSFPCEVNPGDYQCLSVDITGDNIPGINIYRLDENKPERIVASSWFLAPNENEILPMNKYYSFLEEPGFHDNGFHFGNSESQIEESCKRVFPDCSPEPLKNRCNLDCLKIMGASHFPVGVAEKKSAVGVYFMGLNISAFIEFLNYHHYPASFVKRIMENKDSLSHMRYDIGIDYRLEDGVAKIVKTAFFGSV